MAEPVRRVVSGDKHFDFAGLMAHEMIQVTKWTGIEKRAEFYQKILEEDPNAVLAAFTLVAWRESGEEQPPRWGSVPTDLEIEGFLQVDGRRVRMMVEKDADDNPLIVACDDDGMPRPGAKKGTWAKPVDGEKFDDGRPKTTLVPLRHDDGSLRYFYVDTGEEVDPTPTTPGSTGSSTTAKTSGDGSGSTSQHPKDDAA